MSGSRLAAKVGLILLMTLGSLLMWIGAPAGWIFLASRLSPGLQVRMSSLVVILIGIPVTMVVIAKVLGRLNELYGRLEGTSNEVQIRAPWMRSMREERDLHRPRTILDVVMVASVTVAMLLFGAWFLFFAEGGGI